MARNLLLTGATGFLGSELLRRLRSLGHSVIVLKRSNSRTERIDDLLGGVVSYDADRIELSRIFDEHEIHAVVHCATNYGKLEASPVEILRANLMLPLQLLILAKQRGTRCFINTDTILDRNISHYSLSKKQFVEWLLASSDSLTTINVALEHFFGPGDDPSKFVSSIVKDLVKEVPEIALTPGEQLRDFIYIDDVIDAFVHIVDYGWSRHAGYSRFDVGTGNSVKIREFVQLAKKLAGNTRTELRFGALPYRPHETMDPKVDLSGLSRLGWRAKISLDEGLKRTIESHRRAVRS